MRRSDSRQTALKEIVPLYEKHAKMFAPLNFIPGMSKEQVDAVHTAGTSRACRVSKAASKRAAGSPIRRRQLPACHGVAILCACAIAIAVADDD